MFFDVEYRKADGAIARESIEADSRADCVAKLRERGITPTLVRSGGKPRPPKSPGSPKKLIVALLAALAVVSVVVVFLTRSTPEKEPAKVPAVKRPAKPVAPIAKPSPVVTNVVPVADKVERAIKTAHGEIKHKVGYTKAVQAALRSANSEPIQSFRAPPPDPNAPPPPPPRYKTDLQNQLSEYAWSGKFVGVPDPLSDEDARKMVEEPVEIQPDDSEEVITEKKTVMELQRQLKEFLDNGGHADDYMMQLMKRQDAEADTVREAKAQIRDLYKSGDIDLGAKALIKYNEYLRGKGLPPMRETALMKRYKKIAEEKAKAGK